ncbi:hypothetical protein CABS02_15177 [Colletotrichum abscissum]|uniref:PiggyBac transposable element-derived protein domain-containing protein n=1 Tax=Colletotrichum abscissum TaxID=1671311 RepID=A0A9Q0AVG4_9PEZI|nr:hypothetical protein CABS02_15177 [Colletotrichum abscissum]
MVRFTGRSMETTTIPTKPIPQGFKLVVTSLLALLPLATYHVFLDNLFASVKLFRALRDPKIGATGTCRKDGGIDKTLVAERETEGKGIPLGQLHPIPTADGQVKQFTWKDNALVLFLTTVFDETSEVVRNRRRPAGNTAAKKAAREVFSPDVRKDLRIPLAVDEYNHRMNGVDTSDQMRSYYDFNRPVRRGSWQALAWNFLLEVIIINTFLLQQWGNPDYPRIKTQLEWRRQLSTHLMQRLLDKRCRFNAMPLRSSIKK